MVEKEKRGNLDQIDPDEDINSLGVRSQDCLDNALAICPKGGHVEIVVDEDGWIHYKAGQSAQK